MSLKRDPRALLHFRRHRVAIDVRPFRQEIDRQFAPPETSAGDASSLVQAAELDPHGPLASYIRPFAAALGRVPSRTSLWSTALRGSDLSADGTYSSADLQGRYHLVVRSRAGTCVSAVQGGFVETVTFQEGELWWADNVPLRWTMAADDGWPVHLTFELSPGVSA